MNGSQKPSDLAPAAAGGPTNEAGPMDQDFVDLEAGKMVYVEGSSSKRYELIRNTKTEVYSCTCVPWCHSKGPEAQKTCRHLLRIRGKELEMRRVGEDGIAEIERAEQDVRSFGSTGWIPKWSKSKKKYYYIHLEGSFDPTFDLNVVKASRIEGITLPFLICHSLELPSWLASKPKN